MRGIQLKYTIILLCFNYIVHYVLAFRENNVRKCQLINVAELLPHFGKLHKNCLKAIRKIIRLRAT